MSEDGFYWVDLGDGAGWRVAELERGKWWVIGSGDHWDKTEFSRIGEKIVPPSE